MKAIVLHSGGMDSSICLLLACKEFGKDHVVSLGFNYAQRHTSEINAARYIASHFGVKRVEIDLPKMPGWECSSLVNTTLSIKQEGAIPNSFVPARNGLFLLMAAPYAKAADAKTIYVGVMEQEGANSGYPDCSRQYIDLVQAVIRADLQDSAFRIETPLVHMSKAQTLEVAHSLGELEFLLEHTISCYEGISKEGCKICPACLLRNKGISDFFLKRQK